MVIHNQDTPLQLNFSGQSFTNTSESKHHTVTHTDGKPFKCTNCEKSYTTKYNLNKHMSVQVTEETYQSNECYNFYSQYSTASLRGVIVYAWTVWMKDDI